jgi:hypothetical protein
MVVVVSLVSLPDVGVRKHPCRTEPPYDFSLEP